MNDKVPSDVSVELNEGFVDMKGNMCADIEVEFDENERNESLHVDDILYNDIQEENNCKPFSFLQWNVCGLSSKLNDNEFISFVCSFQFICLVDR